MRSSVLVYAALLVGAVAFVWPGSPAGKAVTSVSSGLRSTLGGKS